MVELWNKPVKGQNSVQHWKNKLSALRRHLRGWAAHNGGVYRQQKAELQSTITELDTTAEVRDLTDFEREQLAQSRDHLTILLRERKKLNTISKPR